MTDISISDNHLRGIAATVILLDEMLCDFERWSKGCVMQGPLYREFDDLTPEQKQGILVEIEALRAQLSHLRDELGIEPKVHSVALTIWSKCAWFWSYLVELESKHLKGYGELPGDFAAWFDPKVEAMIERLNAISEISRSKRTPGKIK